MPTHLLLVALVSLNCCCTALYTTTTTTDLFLPPPLLPSSFYPHLSICQLLLSQHVLDVIQCHELSCTLSIKGPLLKHISFVMLVISWWLSGCSMDAGYNNKDMIHYHINYVGYGYCCVRPRYGRYQLAQCCSASGNAAEQHMFFNTLCCLLTYCISHTFTAVCIQYI